MNLSFKIAKKYFFSRKKRSFIHFISIISMIAVSVGTAALIIVLSVFNGLEDLNRQIFKISNPDLQITATTGKSFIFNDTLKAQLSSIENIKSVIEVYQDNALAKQGEDQLIVTIKGVTKDFQKIENLKSSLVEGGLYVTKDSLEYAYIGAGVYNYLNLRVDDFLRPLEIWYPRNQKLNTINPAANINRVSLPVSGVFALEQQYDNYIYLPIQVVEQLVEKPLQRTALELYLGNEEDIEEVKSQLQNLLNNSFEIKDRDELNVALFRAIRIEKLFIFIALLFIIGIASFNIFFSLTMLVIDKRDDIKNLFAMGASESLVKNIFLKEGFLIAGFGSIIGLVIGCAICLSQMYFGWLKMGMQFAVVEAYPVLLKISDIIYSLVGIILITFVASYFPSQKAVGYMHISNQK